MSMFHKDFQAIADELKANYPQWEPRSNQLRLAQWQSDVLAVARALNQLNPRFNHSRFCEACVPPNEEPRP